MKRVAEVKITIENCNNISKGVISLEEEKLNMTRFESCDE